MIRTVFSACRFAFGVPFRGDPPNGILIYPKYSAGEPDTRELLNRLPEYLDEGAPIYLCAEESGSEEGTSLDASAPGNIEVVRPGSSDFREALHESRLVLLKGRTQAHMYRFLDPSSERQYVRLYHGLITKGYGRHARDHRAASRRRRFVQWLEDRYLNAGIDVHTVASEVERFFRASAEGRDPTYFETLGYPRFDRIRELLQAHGEPAIPQPLCGTLDDASTTLLYAPTHKDSAYETELFPFGDFDVDRLHSLLEAMDATLLLRMHPSEEDSGAYDALVDGERIRYAGQSVTESPIELLPAVDVLITDYSSIYVDFLPFDRPIVFIPDRHDRFQSIRGLAFNYDRYFPGEHVQTFEEFTEHVETLADGEADGHAANRQFVRQVLLPDWERGSIEVLLNRFEFD